VTVRWHQKPEGMAISAASWYHWSPEQARISQPLHAAAARLEAAGQARSFWQRAEAVTLLRAAWEGWTLGRSPQGFTDWWSRPLGPV
jgi:hypothetical protein